MAIFKKAFNAASGVLNAAKSALPLNIGIPISFINAENSKYVARISTTSPKMTMYAWLQEKFTLNVSSNWTDSGLMSGPVGVVSDLAQAFTGQSIVSTMATRRKWRGSSPVSMTMKLKFEAFESVKNEVIIPCHKLQSLVLPGGGFEGQDAVWGLTPPGPNPFSLPALKGETAGFERFGKGDEISITIGDFITFPSCVVSSVEITFESRMSADGPVGAEATVEFQTYEMLTKDRLLDAYTGIGRNDVYADETVNKAISAISRSLGSPLGL